MFNNQDNVFNQIAPGWYNFRHWSIFGEELEMIANRWQKGILLNLGCAHGPDFLPFKKGFKLYGIDFSTEMLKLAKKYSKKFNFDVNLSLSDIRWLPYSDNTFDWGISVATFHLITDKEERYRVLKELWRVLKPGGEVFITVWNRWQPKFWLKPKELTIPWKKKDKTLYRYYYLFSYAELEKLVRKSGFKVIKSLPEASYHFPIKTFSKNICLLIMKY